MQMRSTKSSSGVRRSHGLHAHRKNSLCPKVDKSSARLLRALSLKMIQGIEKNTFQANFVFFFQVFSCHFVHLFYNMYEMYESIYVEIMIMPRVKRGPILFWKK